MTGSSKRTTWTDVLPVEVGVTLPLHYGGSAVLQVCFEPLCDLLDSGGYHSISEIGVTYDFQRGVVTAVDSHIGAFRDQRVAHYEDGRTYLRALNGPKIWGNTEEDGAEDDPTISAQVDWHQLTDLCRRIIDALTAAVQ